jgi:hypothetical protein
MFEKLFKNTQAMSWIALLTFVMVTVYVVDQYKTGGTLFGYLSAPKPE